MHARAMPSRIAYTFEHEDGRAEHLSWSELDARVEQMASALATHAAPGARAVLLYPDGLEFIVAFFACLRAGIVAVPATLAHRRRGSRRLPALVADADPALALTVANWHQAVAGSLAQAGAPACVCLCSDMLAPCTQEPTPRTVDGALAFLQYTSGSTAQPRGVEISHANIVANVEAIRLAFGFDQDSVMASWLPLFHDMGLVGSVLAPAMIGFRSILMAPATFLKQPVRWLAAITRYRATFAGAPDFGWSYCARRIRQEQKDGLNLSSLVLAYNGSEPVRAASLRAFAAAFANVGFNPAAQFPCYGLAEATLLVAGGPRGRGPRVCCVSKARLEANQAVDTAPGSADARELVSCGPPAPGTTVLVVDPASGAPVAADAVGEVWVSGPGVARGYWRRPDASEALFNARAAAGARFLRSGDLGFLRDGELFVTGRIKDLLIFNGRNIYPEDLEQVAAHAIDLIEPNGCAAFVLEQGDRERLVLAAEANRSLVRIAAQGPADNARLAQLEALVRQVRAEIARQFGVNLWQMLFVRPGAFPRTTSGKVQRARCAALARSGQLQVVYASSAAGGAAPAPPPAAQESRVAADEMIGWLRRYASRRLNSRLIDERRTIPPYVVLDLGAQGFFGLQAPRAFGGRALATSDLMRVLEQLAAIDLTVATVVGVHNGLGLRPLLRFGGAGLQRRLLHPLASGRALAAYAQTEPAAGSNPLAMQTRAVREQGGWRAHGRKHLIGLASWAGMLTVLAKAVDERGAALGMIALLVPEDAPGLVHGPEALTMGMRGMVQNSVLLDGVFVPDEHVLLAPGEGMEVARDAMSFARLGIGALSAGAMKRCAQLMARYAARREVGTGRLADNPVTLARLHELTCAIHAVEALVGEIAAVLDADAPMPHEACLACKVLASELLWQAADRLVQLLGGRGYVETNLAPQILRDARVLRILEGPSETLFMHLGAAVAASGNGADRFIAGVLGQPALAAELDRAVAAARAAGGRRDPASVQWSDYRCGELCAWALLLAATRRRAALAPGLGAAALAWAEACFEALKRTLREPVDDAPWPAAPVLKARIDAYAGAIGDLDQEMAGEDAQLDPLLKREPPSPAPSGPAPVAAPRAARQLVYDSVLKWLRGEGMAPCGGFGDDTPFTELGMDSLATVPIALELEQLTGLPIAPELLYDYQTVNALAAYIERQRQGAPAEQEAADATR
jgi:acyl-CoA synthetase (AMP-forming)/AMP-acid ligase II/alkylation response protein AidB-like acyl-CoA dehydrogenase